MEISNKFLTFLLVIAILVSVIGTWYSIDGVKKLTGYAQIGYVNVTIATKSDLNITQPYCGFGTGHVTPGFDFAVLYPGCALSLDTKANWTNTTVYDPECLVAKNTGNSFLEVNVSSVNTAASLIKGTSPEYKAWSENKDASACASGLVSWPGTDMDTTNKTICSNLSNTPSTDEIYIGCYFKIPKDAPAEAKNDVWTFTGTAV